MSRAVSISEKITCLFEGFKLGDLGAGKDELAPKPFKFKVVTNDYYILDKKRVLQVYWKESDLDYLMYMAPAINRPAMHYATAFLVAGEHLTVSSEDHFTYFHNEKWEVPITTGKVLVPRNWDWGCESKAKMQPYSQVVSWFKDTFAKINQGGIENMVDFVSRWKPSYGSTDFSEEVNVWAKEKGLLHPSEHISRYNKD